MNRKPKAPPLDSWRVFSSNIYYFKSNFPAGMYGLFLGHVQRLAAEPKKPSLLPYINWVKPCAPGHRFKVYRVKRPMITWRVLA
jgi:hypothetical protein